MKKYKVRLEFQPDPYYGTVYIKAKDEEEAKKLVQEKIDECLIEPDNYNDEVEMDPVDLTDDDYFETRIVAVEETS